AHLVLGLVELQIDRAQYVPGGERLAVVPLHTLAQSERQFRAVFIPRPICRKVRSDRLQAVLFYMLVEQDEIVVDAHQRPLAPWCCLLVNIEAGRALGTVDPEDAAGLLRRG